MATKLSVALRERLRQKHLSDIAKNDSATNTATGGPVLDLKTFKGLDDEIIPGNKPETKEKGYVPFSVTSFAQLDASREASEKAWEVVDLADDYQSLLWHILDSYEIEDKARALETLSAEFIVRLRQVTTQPTSEEKALDTSESSADASQDPIVEAGSKTISDSDSASGIFVYKDLATGRWRFNAVWSNNFEDRDNPPDIVSKKSHLDYIEMCEKGLVPYPEAWTWHIPGSAYGQYDDLLWVEGDTPDTGFTVGFGYFLDGFEVEAEAMSKMKDIGCSHGMLVLERDKSDPMVIKSHITYEISDLPSYAAANELTAFTVEANVNKELPMALTEQQKIYLRSKGVGEERITAIDQTVAEKTVIAQALNMAHKEAEQFTPAPVAPAPAAPAAPPAPAPAAPEETASKEQFLTRAEAAEAFGSLIKAIKERDEVLESIAKTLDMLVGEDDGGDEDDEDPTPAVKGRNDMPRAGGLVDMIKKGLFDEDARIDKEHPLAKSGPKQEQSAEPVTGIKFIDEWIAAG